MSYVWTAIGSRVRKTKSLTEMGNPVISAPLSTTARRESTDEWIRDGVRGHDGILLNRKEIGNNVKSTSR